ncbi:MAG: VacJ family lipoprotein [Burkholderiales bacterium]
MTRGSLAAGVLGSVLWLSGCATAQQPDPLEPLNRKVFAFNEVVDKAVLKPVATAYKDHIPSPVRKGVTNFFANLGDLWSAVNLMLQGRVGDSLSDVMRFNTNTVFGLLGVLDFATPLGMPRHGEDFGRTLGRWGVGPGAYLVWPLLGPSTLRDSVGLPIEVQISPTLFVEQVPVRNTMTATRLVDTRANLLEATGLLDDLSLDKYAFTRNAYLQRRQKQIERSKPGKPDDDEYEEVTPASPAASAPAAAASAP